MHSNLTASILQLSHQIHVFGNSKAYYVDKLHLCIWDLKEPFFEIGLYIKSRSEQSEDLPISLSLPGSVQGGRFEDLFSALNRPETMSLIFNEVVSGSEAYSNNPITSGMVHTVAHERILIQPVMYDPDMNTVTINASACSNPARVSGVYCRFKVSSPYGISRNSSSYSDSTSFFDLQVNVPRFIPAKFFQGAASLDLMEISKCYCLIMKSEDYTPVVTDDKDLKSVRSLEIQEFAKYLNNISQSKSNLQSVFFKKSSLTDYIFYAKFVKLQSNIVFIGLALFCNLLLIGATLLITRLYESAMTKYKLGLIATQGDAVFFLACAAVLFYFTDLKSKL